MRNKLYYRDKKFWTIARNVAIGLMLFGVIVLTLHFTTRQPKYEDMLRDNIVVQQVIYVSYYHSGHYELTSTQGETYSIWPQDAVQQLDRKVKAGAQVEIKHYITTFPSYHHISEMSAGKTKWVTYHNYRVRDFIVCGVFFFILELLGAVLLWFGLWQRKNGHYTKEKTKELKERARLNKTGR